MITCLPGWPAARQYARASFAAVSMASDPPPGVKKTLAPATGARPATRRASASAGGLENGPNV